MKKLLAMVLIGITGLVGLQAAEAEVMNLDFSQKGDDGKIKFWKQRGGAADVTSENGVLTIKPLESAGNKFLLQLPILLKPGATYKLEYETRGEAGMKSTVYVEYRNQDKRLAGVNTGMRPTGKEWRKNSVDFTMPAKFSGPYMVIMISPGNGTCEFRNLTFQCTGQVDPEAQKRMSDAVTCFPLPQQSGNWRKLGAPSGRAEYAGNVLKLTANAERGNLFFLKALNLKTGVKYDLSVLVRQPAGHYGVYIEYSIGGRRAGFNARMVPAGGEAAQKVHFTFTLPAGATDTVLVLAAGNSKEFAEFSDLQLKDGAEKVEPTSASSWQGGKVVTENGKAVLLITDSTAKAKADLRKGQHYRFGFDAATRSGKGVTGFADFQFTAAQKGAVFFCSDWDDIISGAGSSKELVFCSPFTGTAELGLKVRGGIAVFALRLEEVSPQEASPAEVMLTSPAYRGTMYSSRRRDIQGRLTLRKEAVSARITLFDSAGQPRTEPMLCRGGSFTLPGTAGLPVGEYLLQAEPFDGSGKALAIAKVRINVADTPEVFYRFDPRDNTFYRNGAPVHYHGFMAGYEPELAYLYQRFGVTTFMAVAGTSEQLLEMLERADQYGFRLILDLRVGQFYHDNKDFIDEWKRYINYILTPKVLAHPALAGYCSADEPAWCSFPMEKLACVTEYMHRLDPSRPVWINEAPRGSVAVNRRVARLSDAFGVDIYPIPYPNGHSGLPDKTITSVGAYARRCREAAGPMIPIWMVLQGFAWQDLNNKPGAVYPTGAETRFMALDSMANGANAILYWGVANIKNYRFYMDMLNAIGEVGMLSKLWQAGNTLKVPAADGMRIFAGTVDNERYIVALNTTAQELDSGIDLTGLYELPEGKKAVSGVFPGYTARVFASVPRYPGDFSARAAYNAEAEEAAMNYLRRKFAPKEPYKGKACWIWYPGDAKVNVCSSTLYLDFDLKGKAARARLLAAADDTGTLKLNGRTLGSCSNWRLMEDFDVTNLLKAHGNRLEAFVRSAGSPPSGFIAELEIVYSDNTREIITTGKHWQAVKPGTDPRPAEVIAPNGGGAWGGKLEYRK